MTARSDDQWSAEIYYNDGTKIIFESLGDLLSFYNAPEEYGATEPQKDRASVARTAARDYQSKQVIDAREATLVYGSKVQGPMGPDFVAFSKKEDAEAFAAANGGRITAFPDVTHQMVKDLRKY
jgi:copper chaperone NosL